MAFSSKEHDEEDTTSTSVLHSMDEVVSKEIAPKTIDADAEDTALLDTNQVFVRKVLDSLDRSATDYKVEDTLQIIVDHFQSGKNLSRILYYEISSNIFTAQKDLSNGSMLTNLEALVRRVLGNDFLDPGISLVNDALLEDQVREFVLKVFDHIHLAKLQVELIEKNSDKAKKSSAEAQRSSAAAKKSSVAAQKSSAEAQKQLTQISGNIRDLSDKLKDTQREYVAVLGIFATVVVAFTGGMMFSSSILQTMKEISSM